MLNNPSFQIYQIPPPRVCGITEVNRILPYSRLISNDELRLKVA